MELTTAEAWSRILAIAEAKVPEQTYRTWLAPLKPVALSRDRLVVSTGSDFALEWIEDKYGQLLHDATRTVLGEGFQLQFEVTPQSEPAGPFQTLAGSDLEALPEDSQRGARRHAAEPSVGKLNPRYTLDRFVVGSNNELAAAACQAVADAPGKAYNPLFIHGGVGLGKTHLMHSIGNSVLTQSPGTRVAYLPTEQFTNELIAAIQSRTTVEFHSRYRRIDLLLVDDAQFLAGKTGTQEEFFHTFNALYDAQKQIVLTSDRPPKEIPDLQERLVSRFEWGLVTDIRPPDFETRVAILQLKAAQDGLSIPDEVLGFIAERCHSSVRELEGAVIKLLAFSSLTHRDITAELAREVLHGAMGPLRQVTPAEVETSVAQAFGVTVEDLQSKRRHRHVTEPRQVAMYLEKRLLDLPYTRIGARFGGRDHSTVIHAISKVTGQLEQDSELRRKVERLEAELR